MSNIPEIPPAILSRLPNSARDEIVVRRQRSMQEMESIRECRSVSDFLESRIRLLTNDMEYIASAHKSLDFALDESTLSAQEFRDALKPFMPPARLISNELKTLKRQRKIIRDDLEEEMAIEKRLRTGLPGPALYVKAYTDSILRRVMFACGKQKAEKGFNARAFKTSVNSYYGIQQDAGFCHITGDVWPAKDVKAAHIVPKSLTGGGNFLSVWWRSFRANGPSEL